MVGELAAEALGATPEEARIHSVRQTISVKQNPATVPGITVPALILSYEICADCGLEFVHRAAIQQMPVQMSVQQPPPWSPPRFRPPHGFGQG